MPAHHDDHRLRADEPETPSVDRVDQPPPALDPDEHRAWMTRHQREAAEAELWLSETLGETPARPSHSDRADPDGRFVDQPGPDRGVLAQPDPDARNGDPAEPERRLPAQPDPDSWSVEARSGGLVVAIHDVSGAIVTASLSLRAEPQGGRFRIARYTLELPDDAIGDAPIPPLHHIERTVNTPATMQRVIDGFDEPPHLPSTPMRLPPALLAMRPRSNRFYERIAALVHSCQEQGIAYGPRLARDNGVSEGTVRSWVHEARRRGVLAPTARTSSRTPRSAGGNRQRRS